MAALSNYSEKLVLDWLCTDATVTRPTAWYVALFTSAVGDDASGTEVSGAGYARQSVTFDAAASPGGTQASDLEVSFTATGGNYGTVTHGAIFDSLSGGNLLFHGALTNSKNITDGDSLIFPVGDIINTID